MAVTWVSLDTEFFCEYRCYTHSRTWILLRVIHLVHGFYFSSQCSGASLAVVGNCAVLLGLTKLFSFPALLPSLFPLSCLLWVFSQLAFFTSAISDGSEEESRCRKLRAGTCDGNGGNWNNQQRTGGREIKKEIQRKKWGGKDGDRGRGWREAREFVWRWSRGMLCAMAGTPALPPLPSLGHPPDCRDKGRKEVASGRAGDSRDMHLNREKVYLLFLTGDAKWFLQFEWSGIIVLSSAFIK